MTRPIASFVGRSSLIGLLALAGASVTAENSESVAVDPLAVSEPVVQVWGARTRGAKGLFGVHTWVAVKPEGAAEYTVYEVIGWRLRWADNVVVVRSRAPDNWFGAEGELYAEKRGAGVGELIERIDKAAREYPYAKTYSVWPGPNSNTFTAWIARAVPELEADLPATAIGKDYIGSSMVSTAPSGQGFQFSLRGLLGFAASGVDGVELNILGLNFGVSSSGIKLPLVGRIGAPRFLPAAIAVEGQANPGAVNP
jgi:hypothetical protein